jgi:hypothetical protein
MIFSAYELYSDPKSHSQTVTGVGSSQTHDENKMSMAERFKKAFSYKDVTVHFVGVWYVMLKLPFWTSCADEETSGIPFRLLGLRVASTCSLGQSTG